MALLRASLLPLALLQAVLAAPADPAHPMITHAPTPVKRSPDITDDIGSYVNSVIGGLGSGVSSFVASGIPQYFQGFPTGTQVLQSLGINDGDLAAQPTQVLNIPAYGNWTDEGWNVRVHGNVFKQPNISQSKVDDLANVFLIDVDVADLPADQQAQARNVTKSIFVVQQDEQNVTMNFVNDVSVRPGASGGAINARGGAQTINMPYLTTDQGDFDAFVKLRNTTGSNGGHLLPGNATESIQTLNMYANGTKTGNATAYLVPPQGLTILSDIDDILRVTKIYIPKEGLLNSFARPFTPWMNMPEIYANWSASIPDFHFHYLTTTPEQVTRNYMEFIYKTYPLGSFDTRPLNFSDVQATLSIRRFLLDKIFQTFPQRKFILVADTTNSDVMKAYPAMYKDYPGQVQCILLRNTSATDSGNLFPYNTEGFKDIPQSNYMFFTVPDDLTNLDIAGGQCYNATIPQNVTFKTQGLPFGWGNAAGSLSPPATWAMAVGLFAMGMVASL
ncbi:Putative phosphatidate phosphatase APP1, catalytic domain-containing protein [Colletotrichum destructivum]|uniref:Phosphatidate phosphatase APP1, catalytic domain-containing protein n=1 Tax=Colletotrichum destructivum TaxID=34406 RepID=A0AAX4IFY5_9PEZI|nr:Putative phosphatidate phosphatase APP1, catalytic domain-containing protein [Colletotrichum destructivum]